MRGGEVGRLDDGARFVANTPDDVELLNVFTSGSTEPVGLEGIVKTDDALSIFEPA